VGDARAPSTSSAPTADLTLPFPLCALPNPPSRRRSYPPVAAYPGPVAAYPPPGGAGAYGGAPPPPPQQQGYAPSPYPQQQQPAAYGGPQYGAPAQYGPPVVVMRAPYGGGGVAWHSSECDVLAAPGGVPLCLYAAFCTPCAAGDAAVAGGRDYMCACLLAPLLAHLAHHDGIGQMIEGCL